MRPPSVKQSRAAEPSESESAAAQVIRARSANAFQSLLLQMPVTLLVAVFLLAVVRFRELHDPFSASVLQNSILSAGGAVCAALLIVRRVTAFPGTRIFRSILPSFVSSFGLALLILFAFRLDYSSVFLGSSFIISVAVAYAIYSYLLNRVSRRFYVVPGSSEHIFPDIPNAEWITMASPIVPDDRSATLVADLRADHPPAWERVMAEAAVRGYPVYHTKQLLESMTGKVTMEHLSENSFGSLLPNLAWRKIKRLIDVLAALVAIVVLALPMAVVAVLICLDSPGSPFFRHRRMGYGGTQFWMFKFRTMRERPAAADAETAKIDAMTLSDDARITRLGRFLRQYRIDELPQIVNILRGEMSWIGPRPEALELSRWYDAEIPFYIYRHIVRPGITGWAQVTQGHVADLEAVNMKLQYDFYYIKNFSVWIDVLIVFRTIRTILTGFGSK
jgi:lipopolysaccharide/colanic/teichoic acid biosynthesis glycosyltransferase